MGWLEWFLVAAGAFVTHAIGLFGGAQIYGSLEYIRVRPISASIFTIVLWGAILVGSIFVILNWLAQYKTFLLVTMGIGFCLSLRHQEV